VVAAVIAGLVALYSGGSKPPKFTQSAIGVSACNGTTVSGSHNRVNCASTVTSTGTQPTTTVKGLPIPVQCHPQGESVVQQAAASIEVHVWCSELLTLRNLVQTKLKVWVSNPGHHGVNVSLAHWALLVPGATAAREWSSPPGTHWRHPEVLHLPEGTVTAISANPDGAAEVLGQVSGGVNYSFATHWKKQQLAPDEIWHTPLRTSSGERYPDGTLVFYVPLLRRHKTLYEPNIYGLALLNDGHIASLCPLGRWGPRVSAEDF
jgi:hypothetical protein